MTTIPAIADDTAQQHAAAPVGRGWARRLAARWRLIAVACVLLVSASVAAGLYFGQYRTDVETADATSSVISAATEGAVALLSYAPDSLDHDLVTARSHLAGDFLTYYSQFSDQFVAPAAKQKDVHATATVTRAAAVDVHADSARVLIFLNQTTTSRDDPDPVQTVSSVMVQLAKVDGRWLISSFDPI